MHARARVLAWHWRGVRRRVISLSLSLLTAGRFRLFVEISGGYHLNKLFIELFFYLPFRFLTGVLNFPSGTL